MRVQELFSTEDPVEIATKFEAYKAALADENLSSDSGRTVLAQPITGRSASGAVIPQQEGRLITKVDGPAQLEAVMEQPWMQKSVSADVLASLAAQIEAAKSAQADLTKDLTLTSPLATGFVPFDLEAPAKFLAPRPTPLRNRLVRKGGQGLARRYKRILGFSGSGTGGVGLIDPGITETTTTQFGQINYLRGPKISYAADDQVRNYKQFSVSDQVSWAAQFAGQGFQDIRSLSQTTVLYSSMLAEERMLLGARGTDNGYVGAISAPAGVTATARAAAGSEVGVVTAGTYYVRVTAEGDLATLSGASGQSAASAVVSVALTSGQVADITVGTEPAGGTGYVVYANGPGGADPGDGTRTRQGRTGWKTFVLFGTRGTLDTASAAVNVAGSSASALHYDGMLPILLDPAQSGYINRLNGVFSSSAPGSEYQAAFASLWDSVKASPRRVMLNGTDRKQISELLKNSGASAGYRLTVQQDEVTRTVLGSVVTGLVNEVTGDMTDIEVHPWLPQGVSPIVSDELPVPDSQVDSIWGVINVQDYMAVQWPVTQFAYEMSSYWFGTMICYAPAWNGIIAGIKAA